MKRQISIAEIEKIIKEKIHQNGMGNVVGQDKISEIKEKVRSILRSKKLEEAETQSAETQPVQTKPIVPASAETSNPNVTVTTTQDPQKTELIRLETELQTKEKELEMRERMLAQKENQLNVKEKELSYKPELPEKIKEAENAEIIIFSENELSLGMESLSERRFRLKSDPDEKLSPKELWLRETVTKSSVYLVELKCVGQLVFNPFDGTTTFENSPKPIFLTLKSNKTPLMAITILKLPTRAKCQTRKWPTQYSPSETLLNRL